MEKNWIYALIVVIIIVIVVAGYYYAYPPKSTPSTNSSINSSSTGGNSGYGYQVLSLLPVLKTGGKCSVREKLGPPSMKIKD